MKVQAADVLVDEATRDSIIGKLKEIFVPQCAVAPKHSRCVRPMHPQRLRAFQVCSCTPLDSSPLIVLGTVDSSSRRSHSYATGTPL